MESAEEKWDECNEAGWLEAFEHHPKIGNINSLPGTSAATKEWAENEQSGVTRAHDETLRELARENEAYRDKFGFIFIICATGKSAEEMLTQLKGRMNNNLEEEIKIAAAEQLKITKLRIEKLFDINESTKDYEL